MEQGLCHEEIRIRGCRWKAVGIVQPISGVGDMITSRASASSPDVLCASSTQDGVLRGDG
ncbi:hypothetical protein IG631_01353 [Alternaria alternata]|jgi:hypothetical protein|nr:hypothetical protein IG631_01353 [Alternaria alternata]